MRFIYIVIVAMILCACSPIDIDAAQNNVDTFHEMYQENKYSNIYVDSSEILRKSISEEGFIKLLTEAKDKDLGVFKKNTLISKKKIYHLIADNEVLLIYTSEFSKRNVNETFLFIIVDGELKLKGYNYTSIN